MNPLQKEHLALVIKYLGISLITGAISHGFFSGERQIITACIGIVIFVIGTILLRKEEHDFWKTILFSSLFAISIGAFTGGIQHFPDSPERSIWIVPLGFLFSVYCYFLVENHQFWKKNHIYYAGIGCIISILLSFTIYQAVKQNYIGIDNHHDSSSIETPSFSGGQLSSPEKDDTHKEGDTDSH